MDSVEANILSFFEHLFDHESLLNTKHILKLAFSTGIFYGSYIMIGKYFRHRRLWALINKKREQREREIIQLKQSLENGVNGKIMILRKDIVEMSFEDLRLSLQNGSINAVQALEAFQIRALQVHEKTNFACQFIPQARNWAEELDQLYKNVDKKPPLFGIPISVKECVHIAGCEASAGFARFLGQPVEKDDILVSMLKQAGAIPFVTTNVLTTLGSFGCSNVIFGYSKNPYNPTRTTGGSSAGEGVAAAAHASALGLGSDVGGSARTPIHCCGGVGLLPTVSRIPRGSGTTRVSSAGVTAIKPINAPMASQVDSLVWFMRAMCNADGPRMDPYALPMPFNDQIYNGTGPLTIGYYENDNWLPPTPAAKRALSVARNVLEEQGHKLVPVEYPFQQKEMHGLMATFIASLYPDGGALSTEWLRQDIVDPDHQVMYNYFKQPVWWRKLKSKFVRSPYWRTIYAACESDTAALRAKYMQLAEYKTKFFNMWRQYKLDCIICPAGASPALPISVVTRLLCIPWSYTALYNVLGYPAGVIECTRVTQDDERAALDEPSPKDADWVIKLIKECQRGTEGLPMGVQVATLPYQDELCLRVIKELENGVKMGKNM